MITNITLVNESTAYDSNKLPGLATALQTQVSRDFAPIWGRDCKLQTATQPVKGTWLLVLLDNADQAGALGYHDLTSDDLPLGKVFVKTALNYNEDPNVTASHELLEMLADPWINLSFEIETSKSHYLYAAEVCDACEDDSFAYDIGGYKMSDFVYPPWFQPVVPKGTQFDFGKHITSSLQLLTGGYIGIMNLRRVTGWTQLTAQDHKAVRSARAPIGSRRERRRTPRGCWERSTR